MKLSREFVEKFSEIFLDETLAGQLDSKQNSR
jgi:hypothetical protein